MGFKSEEQRKGFFGRLRANIHEHHVQKHEEEKQKLQAKILDEKLKLQREQKRASEDAEIIKAKNELKDIKDTEARIKKERFDRSHTGKFLNAAGRGLQHAVEYERTHAKGQMRQLRKLAKGTPTHRVKHRKKKVHRKPRRRKVEITF